MPWYLDVRRGMKKRAFDLWVVVSLLLMCGGSILAGIADYWDKASNGPWEYRPHVSPRSSPPLVGLGLLMGLCGFIAMGALLFQSKARSKSEAGRMGYLGIPIDERGQTPARCVKCGKTFTRRMPYHRLCDSCYYGRS